MKTMTENFGGNEYPPMKLPKQENATSSFEEKCNGLVEIISRSFDFFMWYAGLPKCRRYELCSTVFFGVPLLADACLYSRNRRHARTFAIGRKA